MNWLKWHVGTFTDPKFAVIAKKSGQPKHAVLAVWAALLETACNDEKRGDVSSFNPEDIGIALDLEPEAVMAIFNAIMARGMVTEDKQLAAWSKRQTTDYSTDRVRKFREKKASQGSVSETHETVETRFTVTETPGNVEEKRGEERRVDNSDANASGAVAPPRDPPLSKIEAPDGDWSTPLFRQGLSWLAKRVEKPPNKLRSFLGECLKLAGDDHKRVFDLLARAERDAVAEPQAWLIAQLGGKAGDFPTREQIERSIANARW